MSKKEINVYWSMPFDAHNTDTDWTFLYPKPQTLFSKLIKEKKDLKDTGSYLHCPAIIKKFKKILVFESPMTCSYKYGYDYDNKTYYINPISDKWIDSFSIRKETLKNKPTFNFSLSYIFYSDDNIETYFTPPFFHKPEYTKYGTIMPGEFNIGNWYRSYNFEIQTWDNEGEFNLIEGEPLFYMEFKTDRPILFHRNNPTLTLDRYQKGNASSKNVFGKFQTLQEKYEKFNKVGYKEKILTEIKKNLIEEEPYRF